jgi:hypothetical protein
MFSSRQAKQLIYCISFWATYLASTVAITLALFQSVGSLTAILVSIPVSWFIGKLIQMMVVARVYSYK